MVNRFINKLRDYSLENPNIESIILVGSYARGTSTENSDIDIVIITTDKVSMVENPAFTKEFGDVIKLQTEYYGACTSVRVWYGDGKEVEFGIVEPSWISTPLDSGTYKVLSDGFKILTDKKGSFKDLSF